MSTKGKRPLLSAHEKVEAIRRVHDGESKASVARDIGVPESTLRGWCKNEDKILLLSRQSTPETSESEPDAKKFKYDYTNASAIVTTLPSTPLGLNYSVTTSTPATTMIPENLNALTPDTVKLTAGYDPKYNLLTTAKPMNTTIPATEKREVSKRTLAERQRTRAELERLSVELGLNRPELGLLNVAGKQDQGINMSMLATSPLTSLNHMSGGTSHAAANLGASFQEISVKVWNQVNQNAVAAATLLNNKSSSAITSSGGATSNRKSTSSDQTVGLNLVQKDNNTTPTKKQHQTSLASAQQSLTDDSMWFWLRAQQELLNLAQNTQKHLVAQQQQQSPSSATSSNSINNTSASAINPNDLKNGSWFWKWYKNYYGFLPNLQQSPQQQQQQQQLNSSNNTNSAASIDLTTAAAAALTLKNNILLQQLTKNSGNNDNFLNQQLITSPPPTSQSDNLTIPTTISTNYSNNKNDVTLFSSSLSPIKDSDNENNVITTTTTSPSIMNNKNSNNRVRAVLDNLLLTNNNTLLNHNGKTSPTTSPVAVVPSFKDQQQQQQDVKENSEPVVAIDEPNAITSLEAIEYGQKFLKWLEDCSDPAVTAMQVIQFKLLLNNIKQSADRKKQNLQNNTSEKVSRRK